MFFSNNFFSFVFFVELLSAAVTLLLVTSTFSSTHFYNNTSLSAHSYFQHSTPTALLQTLMLFFWVTLLSSIVLFTFTITFYLKFLTFDWNIIDSIFTFLVTGSSLKSLFSASFTWFLLLLCLFIKCGVVPFYLWKPSFFKGMGLLPLFFYVYVYYFATFFYFLSILTLFMNELLFFNAYLLCALVVFAALGVAILLFDSFYLKSFLAISSILNSILIFFTLCTHSTLDVLFLI